jgi:predicted MFS family arabinose efflux permease
MGNYGGIQAAGYTASGVFVGSLADFLGYPAAFFFGAAMSALGGALLLGAPNPAPRRAAAPAAAQPRPRGGLHARLCALADPGLWLVLNANTWNQGFQVLQASFLPVLATAVGLGPAQVGIVRAVYSGINMVGRPTAGVFLGRLSLRQVAYLGLAVQSVPLFFLPFLSDFVLFAVLSLICGFGRAIIVVAASTGLAEEVDETRVSRGAATAAYSTSNDVPNVVGPLVVGATASAIGLAYMFPAVAVGIVTGFTVGDLAVARWRLRRAAQPITLSGAT